MDFSTMKAKIEDGLYSSVAEFRVGMFGTMVF